MAEVPDSFLDKWRARWPEWALAEVFIPAGEREQALAWLSLHQELLDAAWGGSDPRPGEAKLGWWQEELQAWQQGMRRHPLGIVLQPRPAPWQALGTALPLLAATRERPSLAGLRPISEAMAAVSAALEPGSVAPDWERVAFGLRTQRLLGREADASRPGDAAALLATWRHGSGAGDGAPRSLCLFEAVLRGRLRVCATGGHGPPARIRTLLAAWRVARGT